MHFAFCLQIAIFYFFFFMSSWLYLFFLSYNIMAITIEKFRRLFLFLFERL